MRLFKLLIFLIIPAFLVGDDQVRGFLYEVESEWILAPEPNLRSCCVGSDAKKTNQIRIKALDKEPPKWKAVSLSGTLLKDPKTQVTYLQNAKIIKEKTSLLFPSITLITLAALAGLFFLRKRSID